MIKLKTNKTWKNQGKKSEMIRTELEKIIYDKL